MVQFRGLLGVLLFAIAAMLVVDATGTLDLHNLGLKVTASGKWFVGLGTVLGAAAGACLTAEIMRIWGADGAGSGNAPRPWRGLALIYPLAPLVAIALIGALILLRGTHDAPAAAVIFLLGSAGLISLLALLAELASGKGVDVESHWGGLGGALGGWTISSPVVVLLLLLASLGGVVALSSKGEDSHANSSNAVVAKSTNQTGTNTTSPANVDAPAAAANVSAPDQASNATAPAEQQKP